MHGLDGRVVVITGAGRGIGRAHALLLASLGASVVVNDLGGGPDGTGADRGAAAAVVEEIRDAGGSAVASTEDVATFDGAGRLVADAVDAFGVLHAVINNAAISRDLPLLGMSESDFDAVVAVNLKGTFNINRHAAEHWRAETETGRTDRRAIVNTSSGAGLHGTAGGTAYAAAKAGVAAMTLIAAGELAPLGVRVNAIAPIARTRLTLSAPGVAELMTADAFDPDHVAPLAAVLAAADCPCTGQVFSVCGSVIGRYTGWSITNEVRTEGRWSVDALRDAIEGLPAPEAMRGQAEVFGELAGQSTP